MPLDLGGPGPQPFAMNDGSRLWEVRARYADRVLALAQVADERIRDAFARLPREAFLPPPPWTTISAGVATTTGDIRDIYENVLVALDRHEGINNGEPSLHAAWL